MAVRTTRAMRITAPLARLQARSNVSRPGHPVQRGLALLIGAPGAQRAPVPRRMAVSTTLPAITAPARVLRMPMPASAPPVYTLALQTAKAGVQRLHSAQTQAALKPAPMGRSAALRLVRRQLHIASLASALPARGPPRNASTPIRVGTAMPGPGRAHLAPVRRLYATPRVGPAWPARPRQAPPASAAMYANFAPGLAGLLALAAARHPSVRVATAWPALVRPRRVASTRTPINLARALLVGLTRDVPRPTRAAT